MANSLRASAQGLAIVDQARRRRGWTKTSTACWWQDAHTSRATLRRFWQGDRIQQDIFIAICHAVGVTQWEAIADLSDLAPALSSPPTTIAFYWNEAPDIEGFYGRNQELQQLEQWIGSAHDRLVMITGTAGIGKTALALTLADRVQQDFECLIWKSLQAAPSLRHLLDTLLAILNQPTGENVQQDTSLLMQYLGNHCCLLVLDGLETVLQSAQISGEYDWFLRQLTRGSHPGTAGQKWHPSCILLTSRERPTAIDVDATTVRCLALKDLRQADALQLLKTRGLTGNDLTLSALSRLYNGNPLALKAVIPLIQTVFGGNVAVFLDQHTLVVGDRLRTVLTQQLEQLSTLEREILYWFAIWQEPISFCRLQTHLLTPPDLTAVLEGIAALERRSLLQTCFVADQPAFTLQSLVMKVVTDQVVEQAVQELALVIQNNDIGNFKVLRTHGLLRPGSDDIAGDRIIRQLRGKLWQVYGAALPSTLQQILLLLQQQPPVAIGYIGCNLTALAR